MAIMLSMKAHPQNENMVLQAVRAGELEIDPQGRVWRVMKRGKNRWTGEARSSPCPRTRAEFKTAQGYLVVRAMIDGVRFNTGAHRLVWLAAHGLIPQSVTVNHKNGNKADNRPENLELATYSEQRKHAVAELGAKHWDCRGSLHPKTHLTESDVTEIRRLRSAGMMVKDIAAKFVMKPKAVSAICNRRTWMHVE